MTSERIGIIGAGTMGNGIAQVCAIAGLTVVMVDVSESAIRSGIAAVRARLDRLVEKGVLTPEGRAGAAGRLQGSTTLDSLGDVHVVIEAATEDLEFKLRLLRDLDALIAEDAVIATNTSSISITQLAAVLRQPERLIGLHFFNPVPQMPLVEIIRGLRTSDSTHRTAVELASTIGKTSIDVRNTPGFVVNRILCPMINEAIFVLQEGGATAANIDACMKLGCNHAIGPLALADVIGLDVLLAIMQVFLDGFNDPKYRPAHMLREMVAAGHLGRKSGRGFFDYRSKPF